MAIFGDKNERDSHTVFERDPNKAKRFFDHAKVVTDSRNYDYAVQCYIDGLRYDPGQIAIHELLRDVALKRNANGGKPAGFKEKFMPRVKGAVDRLLHTEMLWSKDPLNVSLMVEVMTRAAEADQAKPDLKLDQLARWVGHIVLEANQTVKNPNKGVYIKIRDLFTEAQAFPEAVRACKLALQLDPENVSLANELKDLEAEQAMQEGGYTTGRDIQEGGFRDKVKDINKQRQLEHQDAVTKRVSAVDEDVQRCRALYEEDPEDLDRLVKLAGALFRKETDQTEDEAVSLLSQAFEKTGQYRYKMQIGDIRMKQMNRRLRQLQAKIKANPDDARARRDGRSVSQQKLRFELAEFTQRVKQYPTDLGFRYELGKVLFVLKKYDEAIAAFQQAKVDPKYRVVSLDFLGRCYTARGWLEEAVDTLRQGIEAHPAVDDRLALELRYQLMAALYQLANKERSVERAREAQKIASQVLQTDINFRDIRQQMEQIRKLVDDLVKHQ